MSNRPDFFDIKSYDEFKKYYFYQVELSNICKELKIDDKGTKQELNYRINEYFKGNLIKKKNTCTVQKDSKAITLDCPLFDCGFSFNKKFRDFFSKQTGIDNFKFTADMATAWRKVKKENDKTFTIQHMLDIYNHTSDYARYDSSSCEWNTFLKDFCADERNAHFKNKLKVASVLWNIVKNSSLPKVYSYALVLQYNKALEKDNN